MCLGCHLISCCICICVLNWKSVGMVKTYMHLFVSDLNGKGGKLRDSRRGPQIKPNRQRVSNKIPTLDEIAALKHKKKVKYWKVLPEIQYILSFQLYTYKRMRRNVIKLRNILYLISCGLRKPLTFSECCQYIFSLESLGMHCGIVAVITSWGRTVQH